MKNKQFLMVKILIGVVVLMFSLLISSCGSLGEPVSSDWPDMRITHDEFNNTSFIHSTNLNGYGSWVPIELYIGVSDGIKVLRLKVTYRGSNWVFFERATIINDEGANIQYTFNKSEINRDVLSGAGVQESVDIVLSVFNEGKELSEAVVESEEISEILQIGKHSNEQGIKDLSELLNGTNVRIRFSGNKYDDVKIYNPYLTGLRNVIAYYESITTKLSEG